MNPSSTLRLRSLTAALAVAWACLGIFLSVAALNLPEGAAGHPFIDTRLGGAALVAWVHPMAIGTGLEEGDRIVELNGEPYAAGPALPADSLRSGVPNRYGFRKSNGEWLELDLYPVPARELRTPFTMLLHVVMICVAGVYLITGGAVWWLKPGRSGAWALLLFCSAMAVQLSLTMHSDSTLWSWSRLMINIPLMGATAFHLFTTYPIEPEWIVRYRRTRAIPYAIAFSLLAWIALEEAMGMASPWVGDFAFFYGIGLMLF
jgi:hypothetical protein